MKGRSEPHINGKSSLKERRQSARGKANAPVFLSSQFQKEALGSSHPLCIARQSLYQTTNAPVPSFDQNHRGIRTHDHCGRNSETVIGGFETFNQRLRKTS